MGSFNSNNRFCPTFVDYHLLLNITHFAEFRAESNRVLHRDNLSEIILRSGTHQLVTQQFRSILPKVTRRKICIVSPALAVWNVRSSVLLTAEWQGVWPQIVVNVYLSTRRQASHHSLDLVENARVRTWRTTRQVVRARRRELFWDCRLDDRRLEEILSMQFPCTIAPKFYAPFRGTLLLIVRSERCACEGPVGESFYYLSRLGQLPQLESRIELRITFFYLFLFPVNWRNHGPSEYVWWWWYIVG